MKNKTRLLVALSLMIVTLASISYAAFFVSKNQTSDNKVLSGCFNTSFTENSASIRMDKALPLTNEQGLNTNPYSFTISNTCSINADYTLLLNVKNNSFSDEYISYNYSGNEVKTLNTASVSNTVPVGFTKSYILGTGTLKRGKSETINIKLWLNELADYQNMTNKTFEAEIQIVSTVSTNQTYGDVTLAYTKDGEETTDTLAELASAGYVMNNVTCSDGSASIVTATTGGKSIQYSSLPAVCTVDFKKRNNNIYCVDASGNEITCPNTWIQGDRIAIGRETPQYFRYLRTTSTSRQLAECGTTSSVACADSTNGDYRFLAEYNLKRTGTASSNTAIASDALQDPSDSASTNTVQYGPNTNYNQSYVKTYMANYQSVLNTMIGETNAIKVNLLSKAEVVSLFGCPSGTSAGACSSIPAWAKNSIYWLGSAKDNTDVWFVYSNGSLYNGLYYSTNNAPGGRAVVNIPFELFN